MPDSVVHPVQAAVTEHLQSHAYMGQYADMTQLAAAKHEPSQQPAPSSGKPVISPKQRKYPSTNDALQPAVVQPVAWASETVPGLTMLAPLRMPAGVGAVPDRWAKATTVEEPVKSEYERRPIEVPYKRVDHSWKPASELGKTQKDIQAFLHTMDPKELLRLCAQLCVEDAELFQTMKTAEPEAAVMGGGGPGYGGCFQDPELCKIFIRGLNPQVTTGEKLREVFEAHGTVVDVHVVKDKATGVSKGYGFVTMSTAAEAAEALKTPQIEIDGSTTNSNLASQRRTPRFPPFNPGPAFNPGYGQFATGW